MKTVLITGCAGFIGSHLTERLISQGYNVIGLDNFDDFYPREIKLSNLSSVLKADNFELKEIDITDNEALSKLDASGTDMVIHLAAKAGVLPSLKDPASYLKTNVLGTQNLLEWMRLNGINKLVFGSSSSVYGNAKKTPFHETLDVSNPISPYAFTKVSGEILIQTYHRLYDLNAILLRFFTVIGERQRPDLAVNKFVRMIKNGEPVTMFGDGSTARDYTYVGDIVHGISQAVEYIFNHHNVCEIINLGNNHPITLREMIATIYKVLDRSPDVIQMPMQKGDVQITYADIKKAQGLLKYDPKVSFESGVRKFLESLAGQA